MKYYIVIYLLELISCFNPALSAEITSLIENKLYIGIALYPGLAKKMNIEHRTLNVQHRMLYFIYLKNAEPHALKAPEVQERI